MSEQPIGTCSNCGGTVMVYVGPWYGSNPPTPTCSHCGASPRLPVIQMGAPYRVRNADDFREMPSQSQQEYFGIKKS